MTSSSRGLLVQGHRRVPHGGVPYLSPFGDPPGRIGGITAPLAVPELPDLGPGIVVRMRDLSNLSAIVLGNLVDQRPFWCLSSTL